MSNFQQQNNKNHRVYKETGKYRQTIQKKKKKSSQKKHSLGGAGWGNFMEHIVDKDENNFLKVLKEPKKNVYKVKTIMYKQDKNVY